MKKKIEKVIEYTIDAERNYYERIVSMSLQELWTAEKILIENERYVMETKLENGDEVSTEELFMMIMSNPTLMEKVRLSFYFSFLRIFDFVSKISYFSSRLCKDMAL